MTWLPPQPHDNLDQATESILEPEVPAGSKYEGDEWNLVAYSLDVMTIYP
jgi:hypothetical protein